MTLKTDNPPDTRYLHKLETAGRLVDNRIPLASGDDTVADMRERLRSGSYNSIDLVLITDGDGRYAGVVELASVLKASGEMRMATILDVNWPVVTPDTDQEHAAELANTARVAVLPVIGRDGHPLGIILPSSLWTSSSGSIAKTLIGSLAS